MKRTPIQRKTPLRRTAPKAKAPRKKRAMPSRGPWRSNEADLFPSNDHDDDIPF